MSNEISYPAARVAHQANQVLAAGAVMPFEPISNRALAVMFGIMRDESRVMVESFNLKNSAGAIAKLKRCSQEVHRKNPADPFSAH